MITFVDRPLPVMLQLTKETMSRHTTPYATGDQGIGTKMLDFIS